MDVSERIGSQWHQLKTQEVIKQRLFEDLLANYKNAIAEKQNLLDEISTLKYNERNLHRDRTELEMQLRNVEAQSVWWIKDCQRGRTRSDLAMLQESSPFVLVLIDGDAAPFLDEFVKGGVQGGRQAVHQLYEQIETVLKNCTQHQLHWQLIIRVYAKLSGLASAYYRGQIIDSVETFESFCRGFNEVYALSEIIDAGNDKEGADTKVEQNLKLFAANRHCKHILLAGSSDKSYVRHLRPYSLAGKRQSNIMLIESIPFPHEFAELARQFDVKEFPEIFRPIKIEIPLATLTKITNGAPISYALRAAIPVTIESPEESHAQPVTPYQQAPAANGRQLTREPKIQLNRSGQRIDGALRPLNKDVAERFWNKRLCNRFYLTKCLNAVCAFKHDYGVMSNEQLTALRHIARSSACPHGADCRDRYCVSSHNCSFAGSCQFGKDCKFPHITDLKVVKEI